MSKIQNHLIARLALLSTLALAGCASQPVAPPGPPPAVVRGEIEARLPAKLADRRGWARDIEHAFGALGVTPTVPHLCAVLAVTAQESGFRADPEVPHLATIARDEIDRRAAAHHIPAFLVAAGLQIHSPDGRSYAERLRHVRTEGELSRIFEDLIASLPLGRQLFRDDNPVRTGGAMQVSVGFAERWVDDHDYPYLPHQSMRREVFTRRGGLYFGIARLLAYPVSYNRMIYRFADYNAGFYASRNAAFQHALNVATGSHLALDGDLVSYGDSTSATERAARLLETRLGLDDGAIHAALARGERHDFEATALYRGVFRLADARAGKPLARAMLPRITLDSPKISRHLTTAWFAKRVDRRYRACLH